MGVGGKAKIKIEQGKQTKEKIRAPEIRAPEKDYSTFVFL